MNNLLARVLTSVVVVPFLILAINWSNPLAVWGIVLVGTAIALREWMNMTLKGAPALERWFGVVVGTGLGAALYWWGERPLVIPALAAAATVATFLFLLFRHREIETVAGRISHMLAGYLYCLLLTFLALLKNRPDGAAWIYIALTVAWLSDTGAYFAGRFIGPYWPRKLWEAVSPKKTVVGALGGVAASFGALVLAKYWYGPLWGLRLSWLDCVAIAVPANVLGQLGDLAESLIKRSVGVKDSGALLPGHGGMLDRIDALLFVVPAVFAYARWVHGLLP